MEWTLTDPAIASSPILDRYFLGVGRALCIASHFEDKINHIVRVIQITDAIRAGSRHDDIRRVAMNYKRLWLDGAIKATAHADDFVSASHFTTLNDAKESRNYIAHESASLGNLHFVTPEKVLERAHALAPHILTVAKGECLVSQWSFEICEREPAPSSFCTRYPYMILNWTLGELIDVADLVDSPQ